MLPQDKFDPLTGIFKKAVNYGDELPPDWDPSPEGDARREMYWKAHAQMVKFQFVVVGLLLVGVMIFEDSARGAVRWVGQGVVLLLGKYWGRLAFEAAFITACIGLYRFRRRAQRKYGLVECAFAAITAWLVLDSMVPRIDMADVIAMSSAGYLFVRGLVNMAEANKKAAEAALARPLAAP